MVAGYLDEECGLVVVCEDLEWDLTKTIRCLVCGGALGRLRTWSGGFGNASTCGIMGHAVMGTDL